MKLQEFAEFLAAFACVAFLAWAALTLFFMVVAPRGRAI